MAAGVMERYWNDPELMSKIASKMGAMQLAPGKPKSAKKAVQASPPAKPINATWPSSTATVNQHCSTRLLGCAFSRCDVIPKGSPHLSAISLQNNSMKTAALYP